MSAVEQCPVINFLKERCKGSTDDTINCQAYTQSRHGNIEKVVNSNQYTGCPFYEEIKRFHENFVQSGAVRFEKNMDNGSDTIMTSSPSK